MERRDLDPGTRAAAGIITHTHFYHFPTISLKQPLGYFHHIMVLRRRVANYNAVR